MPMFPDQVNLANLAFLRHLVEEELEIQQRIVKTRAILNGYFDETLAAETANSLVGGTAEEIEGPNLAEITLRTIIRRVDIQGITGDEGPLLEWMENIYDACGLEILQGQLHEWAERDGEAFVIVDYNRNAPRPWDDSKTGLPVITIHERYTSAEVTYGDEVGTNYGCKAHYRNNDPFQPLEMISLRWIDERYEDEELIAVQRMNLYINAQNTTPARVEKYEMDENGEWVEYRDTFVDASGNEVQEEWPLWWTDNLQETGRSLPIFAIHFRNEKGTPITRKIEGLQHGMDHAWSSFLINMVLAGHQILKFFGWTPTTDGKTIAADGSNLLRVRPRTFIGSPNTKPDQGSLDPIQAGDISESIDAMDKIAIYAAFVSGLPINNFIISKAVASSSTLRQGEADLVAHVNALTRIFGRAWQQVFEACRVMELMFGTEKFEPSVIRPIWAPPETVNVEARAKEADAQSKTGVPEQFIWRYVWGYSEKQVTEMEKMKAEQAAENGEETAVSDMDSDSNLDQNSPAPDTEVTEAS